MQERGDEHTRAARHFGRRMARWVVLAAEVCIIAVWVLQQLTDDGWWGAIAVALIPSAVWLIPAAIAVGAAMAGRDGVAIAAALVLIPVVLFGLMGAQWRVRTPEVHDDTIVVATWNVGNEHEHAAAARRIIARSGADVCLMQEAFDSRFLPHLTDCQCRGEETQRICLMHPARGDYELSKTQMVPLEGSFRDALSATIKVGGRSFDVLSVHIARRNRGGEQRPPSALAARLRRAHARRRMQIASIARWARTTERPFVIAGDFNTPPRENIFGPLRNVAFDAFGEAGQGFGYTFPDSLPLYRIDAIWVSRHFQVLCTGVAEKSISDHRLVWAELQIVE